MINVEVLVTGFNIIDLLLSDGVTLFRFIGSMAPSPFFVRVHISTSFIPIVFLAPAKQVIELPERCGPVKISLRSASFGQMIVCTVKQGL